MDAKLTENLIFVWGTGKYSKYFVLQFIILTFIYTQIIFVVIYALCLEVEEKTK